MHSLLRMAAGFALLGVAAAAGAATLTIDLDKDVYEAGETVTITITGDSQGAAALGAYGQIEFTGLFGPNMTFVPRPARASFPGSPVARRASARAHPASRST